MKTTFLHQYTSLIFLILLGLQISKAQNGITSFSAESIIPTILPIQDLGADSTSTFIELNTQLSTIRDTISIGDGVTPIIGAFEYTEDSLLVENGDSINFTVNFNNDTESEMQVKIWYDMNNDGLQIADELVYEGVAMSSVTAGFPFPNDVLLFTEKSFFVGLMADGQAISILNFKNKILSVVAPVRVLTSSPKTSVPSNCVPEKSPILLYVENSAEVEFRLDSIELTANESTISYSANEIGLPEIFPSCSFPCAIEHKGVITHNFNTGTEGYIRCLFVSDNLSEPNSVWLPIRFKIGCCSEENIEYQNTDANILSGYTSAWGFIKTGDNININPEQIVIFKAGDYIQLKDGFHAKNGSFFHGLIEGCIPVLD